MYVTNNIMRLNHFDKDETRRIFLKSHPQSITVPIIKEVKLISCDVCKDRILKTSSNKKYCEKCYKKKMAIWVRNSRIKNPSLYKEITRRYRNTKKGKEYIKNRNKIRQGVEGILKGTEWNNIKLRYENKCLCCKKSEPEIILTIDHIIPISKGGKNIESNIQPLCMNCNRIKSDNNLDFRL